MTDKPRTLLMEVKELIKSEDRWTQYAWARDEDGFPVDPLDSAAVQWCLGGAIIKVRGSIHFHEKDLVIAREAIIKAIKEVCSDECSSGKIGGDTYLLNLNDRVGYASVIKVLDRTID